MSSNNPNEPQNGLDEVNETLTGLGQKVQNNPRVIVWACVAVAAIVCIVLLYVYAIRQPGINAANDALGQADMQMMMGNDSVALAQYKAVAADHGYDAGNLANLNAAIILYKQRKFQDAINYLNNYESSESVIGASAKSLEGDCFVNLKKYPEAIDCFKQAVTISDNNPSYTPAFMLKEATVYREMKNYKDEAEIYRQIISLYPNYGREMGIDLEKYLARAEASK